MNNLTQNIKKEIDIANDGKIFSSRRGLAYLCGVDIKQIHRDILTRLADDKSVSKSLISFAGQDFRGADKLPDYLCAAIIQHYAFKGKEEAQEVLMLFSAIGFRQWGQQIKGWNKDTEQFNNVYIKRLCFSADKIKIPANHWIIFDECGKLMRFLERNVEINKFDLVDGSVGKRWSHYRKQQAEKGADWLHDRAIYEHPFPDKRGSKECWAYHVNELARFRVWFQGEYIPFHLWSYLKGKYPVDTVRQLEASHHQLVLT